MGVTAVRKEIVRLERPRLAWHLVDSLDVAARRRVDQVETAAVRLAFISVPGQSNKTGNKTYIIVPQHCCDFKQVIYPPLLDEFVHVFEPHVGVLVSEIAAHRDQNVIGGVGVGLPLTVVEKFGHPLVDVELSRLAVIDDRQIAAQDVETKSGRRLVQIVIDAGEQPSDIT